MIKNKENVCEVVQDLRSFSYVKEGTSIEVALMTEENINIRYYDEKLITINYCQFDEGISTLYKDRKYINKVLFQ